MKITVGQAVAGLLFASATGVASVYTTLYWYYLMQMLGVLLVLPVAAFVALQVFLVLRLEGSADPLVQAIGRGFGAALMYLALFEALVFTVLVIWAISLLFGDDPPASRAAFTADFVLAAGYLSCFIYGGTGLTVLIGEDKLGQRIAGALYALVTIGVPVTLLIGWETALTAWARANPGDLLLYGLAYLLAGSVVGMWMFVGRIAPSGAAATRKGRPKDRRP